MGRLIRNSYLSAMSITGVALSVDYKPVYNLIVLEGASFVGKIGKDLVIQQEYLSSLNAKCRQAHLVD